MGPLIWIGKYPLAFSGWPGESSGLGPWANPEGQEDRVRFVLSSVLGIALLGVDALLPHSPARISAELRRDNHPVHIPRLDTDASHGCGESPNALGE